MNILFHRSVYEHILQICIDALPEEACGALIGGLHHASSITIERFIPIKNVSEQAEQAFVFDSHEWTALIFRTIANNEQIIGIVHSHPKAAATPSLSDLESQWHTLPVHCIVSLSDMNTPVLKAYSFHSDGRYDQLNWSLID